MVEFLADCVIEGIRTLDSLNKVRRPQVEAIIKERYESGKITKETYNSIFNIIEEVEETEPGTVPENE